MKPAIFNALDDVHSNDIVKTLNIEPLEPIQSCECLLIAPVHSLSALRKKQAPNTNPHKEHSDECSVGYESTLDAKVIPLALSHSSLIHV